MPQPPPSPSGPSFYLIGRRPLHPGVLLLALAAAAGALCLFLYAMGQARQARLSGDGNVRSAGGAAAGDDDQDDPNQIDTIVLGDPGDAPVPAHRGDHVSPVHPTILIVLPRAGDQSGLIPDTAAGQLLYGWLAAFNSASASGLATAVPSAAPGATTDALLALRKQNGGFNLLSAKEIQPGLVVFRLRDQSPVGVEALGALQVRPDSVPAAIGSFSLRVISDKTDRK